MKKISLIALLLTVSFIPNANAQVKADGEAYRTTWGVPADFKRCEGLGKDAGFSDASVGTNSAWDSYLNKSFTENGGGGWGYGAWYYVAHEMADHGYKFCKTIVAADRSCLTCNVVTMYGKPATEDCFWLCEKGYYGQGCTSETLESPSAPDNAFWTTTTNRAKIATGGVNSLRTDTLAYKDNNIENTIPMFYNGLYETCSGGLQINLRKMTKKQEHDVVLAIKKIESSGSRLTFTLQPMVVRAASAKGDSNSGWPMISWTGNENNTYCPAEMFLHSDDGGCIGYDKDVADAQDLSDTEKTLYESAMEKAAMIEKSGLDLLCSGWPREKYDNKVHVLNSDSFMYQNWRKLGDISNNLTKEGFVSKQCPDASAAGYADCKANAESVFDNAQSDASATCTVFVCKDEGTGYKSDPMGAGAGDFTCVSCMQNDDATIHPSRLGVGSDGICKVCAVGEVYSSTTKTCEKAKSIHKYYMGGLLTKGDIEPRELNKQCWTMPTPDEYKACIAETNYADGLLPPEKPEE